MKQKWLSTVFTVFLLMVFSCSFDIADLKLSKSNKDRQKEFYKTVKAFQEVDFLDYAQPLVFGVSATPGDNSIVKGGNNSGFYGRPNDGVAAPGPIPESSIEIRSESGRGKVAGSEDGMVFYFKEVSVNKNFKMQADFKVLSFLPSGGTAPNGQEAWGIMARDFIPQYGHEGNNSRTMEAIAGNAVAQRLTNRSLSQYYYVGNTGGDSNMIMVGGVKRGIRAYWRRGVAYNGTTPLSGGWEMGNGNPTEPGAMDHTNTNFYYWPREWGNYGDLGDTSYQERPDFPRYYNKDNPDHYEDVGRKITYRLTLEKNNNGFHYIIEHPDEGIYPEGHLMSGLYKKGRIRDRTASDSYNKDIIADPNSRDPRPIIEPIDRGTIPPYEDILKSVNQENYYVGLFAARDAVVWVSNIKYWEADIDDCDPQDVIVPSQLDATLEVLTPAIYTGTNYLHVKTNVPGHLVVSQERKVIPESVIQNIWVAGDTGSAVPHNLFIIPIMPPNDGDNTFMLTFYPNKNLPPDIANSTYEGVALKSTDAINRTFVLKKKLLHGGTGDIFAGANGSPRNSGSRDSPLDLQTAIYFVQPGQDIVLLDGVYYLQETIIVPRYNDGRSGAPKTLRAENLNKAALDWSWKKKPENNKPPYEPMKNRAFLLAGNYWVFDGFHIRNSPDDVKGMEISGSNNIAQQLTIYSNGDTGLQIAGASNEPTRYWPSNNRIEYCESFNNRDPANTNADGFSAKLTVGKDNAFYRCIGHNNVDDSWDFFAKRETGPIGIVLLNECVAYGAGVLYVKQEGGNWAAELWGTTRNMASRNGFKMGGEGIPVRHTAVECVSFGNDGYAFTSNSNPSIIVRNSTSINLSGGSLEQIRIYGNSGTIIDGYEENCISNGSPHPVNFPPGGVNGILFGTDDPAVYARSLDGFDGYQGRFLKRKPDGRPDLGDVFKSGVPGKGAWALYD